MAHLNAALIGQTYAAFAVGDIQALRVRTAGDSAVAMTLDRYSHVIPALQEKAAQRVAELLFHRGMGWVSS